MKSRALFFISLVALLVSACGAATPSPTPMPTETPTATPDPCSAGSISFFVQQANGLMREYDDTTYVANLTLQTQLGDMILKLQDIRRRTEDLELPVCLEQLKQNEIGYMNSVIQYLAIFMAGGDRTQVTEMIKNTQNLRASFDTEKQRLLNLGAQSTITDTPLPSGQMQVSNPDGHALNLHREPSLTSTVEKLMKPGERVNALARTADGTWILVEYDGERLWVYADQVTLSGNTNALPVFAFPTTTPTE
jgi:hypothetical protein